MNWKWAKISITVFVGLIIIIPLVTYICTTDWSHQHNQSVNNLTEFNEGLNNGQYRLTTANYEFLIRLRGFQNSGSAVILLHGFPETSIMWETLMDSLATAGHRVLAFDQRGYSPGARPRSVEDYQIDSLASDVIAIADKVGFDTFHLVGHDWGAAVGWKVTMDYPERIYTWTAMAIPHIGVFFPATINHPKQKERSGYMSLLRMPIVPELFYHAFQNKVYNGLKDRWTNEQIVEYRKVFKEPGAFKAVLNWYRAMDVEKAISENLFDKSIHRPTFYIYGNKDPVIAPEIIPLQEILIDTTYNLLELDVGHSLMQEAESEVIKGIMSHLQEVNQIILTK